MPTSTIARSEFILGGQKSGKSRRAEELARQWLAESSDRAVVLIATAQPFDEEMSQRIARHQADRARQVPAMRVVEEPVFLSAAIEAHSAPHTLVVVDCVTLWLTNLMMPSEKAVGQHTVPDDVSFTDSLLQAIRQALGPVVLVGNEIGMGVIPMGREVRAFVDALGRLNQELAAACQRVTLMSAGLALVLKDAQ
jgi:adenosylcobinamide kinase/adenosylcobinamide-phosphate guanylyltransferase